jgi:hypothetical protein
MKKIITVLVSALCLLIAIAPLANYAAEVRTNPVQSSSNGSTIEEKQLPLVQSESLKEPYLFSATNIEVTSSMTGDLVSAANGDIVLKETANLYDGGVNLAAAQNITILSKTINSAARLASAKEVLVDGTLFGSDLIVLGSNTITIKNTIINGDLMVFSNSVVLENTTVKGKLTYATGTDIKKSSFILLGEENKLTDVNFNNGKSAEEIKSAISFISGVVKFYFIDIGIIVLFIVIIVFLSVKKRLLFSQTNSKYSIAFDGLTGFLLVVVAPVLAVVITLFSAVSLILHMAAIVLIIFLVLFLSASFTPIYLANVAHRYGIHGNMVLMSIGFLVLMVLLSYFGGVWALLAFVANLSAFGFLVRKGIAKAL